MLALTLILFYFTMAGQGTAQIAMLCLTVVSLGVSLREMSLG